MATEIADVVPGNDDDAVCRIEVVVDEVGAGRGTTGGGRESATASRVHVRKEWRDHGVAGGSRQRERRVRPERRCKRDVAVVVDVEPGVRGSEKVHAARENRADVDKAAGAVVVAHEAVRAESRRTAKTGQQAVAASTRREGRADECRDGRVDAGAGLLVRVGAKLRHVVDDPHAQRGGRVVAVNVPQHHLHVVEQVIGAVAGRVGLVVQQGVLVGHDAGGGVVAGHRQGIAQRRTHGVAGEAAAGAHHQDAVDEQAAHAIWRDDSERTDVAGRTAAGLAAVRQEFLEHRRVAAVDRGRQVENLDALIFRQNRHDDAVHAAEQQRFGSRGNAGFGVDRHEVVIQRHERVAALSAGRTASCGTGRGGGQQLGRVAAGRDGGLDVLDLGGGNGRFGCVPFRAIDVGVQHGLGVTAQVEPAAVVELDCDGAGIGSANHLVGVDDVADHQYAFDTVLADRDDLADDLRDDTDLLRCHECSPGLKL
nr:K785 [uncultured bacterium]